MTGMGRNRTWTLALGLISLTILGTACSSDGQGSAGSTTSTSTTILATTATTSAPATEPSTTLGNSDDTGKSELADGRHYGFWKTLEIGDTVAFGEFDLAYFLTGTEAEKAAASHGDDLSNDYYVVNDNTRLRTLIVNGDAEVTVVDWDNCCGTKPSNVADLAVDRRESSGFWVTIENGAVTKIEEQYVP
jgi:hypothetical protein